MEKANNKLSLDNWVLRFSTIAMWFSLLFFTLFSMITPSYEVIIISIIVHAFGFWLLMSFGAVILAGKVKIDDKMKTCLEALFIIPFVSMPLAAIILLLILAFIPNPIFLSQGITVIISLLLMSVGLIYSVIKE